MLMKWLIRLAFPALCFLVLMIFLGLGDPDQVPLRVHRFCLPSVDWVDPMRSAPADGSPPSRAPRKLLTPAGTPAYDFD